MVTLEKQLTADEFWEQYAGQRVELVRGEPVEMTPTSHKHGVIVSRMTIYLGNYVLEHDLGEILGAETGFLIGQDPDILRAADIAFIEKERLADIEDPYKFTPFPPDLAVEVVSPHDRAGDIQAKVSDYLNAGVRLMWVIYPQGRQVVVHRSGGTAETLDAADTLTGGDVLPGFALPLAKLFPAE